MLRVYEITLSLVVVVHPTPSYDNNFFLNDKYKSKSRARELLPPMMMMMMTMMT
jgi:hypothetical protein